jgi:hypothetical protein
MLRVENIAIDAVKDSFICERGDSKGKKKYWYLEKSGGGLKWSSRGLK